jgi:hypothetical protein
VVNLVQRTADPGAEFGRGAADVLGNGFEEEDDLRRQALGNFDGA